MNYTEYNDRKGRDQRLSVEAWRASRARMLEALKEYDFGAITLYMSKYELQARCRAASMGFVPPLVYGHAAQRDARESAYVGTGERK